MMGGRLPDSVSRASAIMRLALLRLFRERSNLFFVIAFPLLLVLLIGLSFGGQSTTTVLVVGDASDRFLASVEEQLVDQHEMSVRREADLERAVDDLGRGRADAILAVPPGTGDDLAGGRPVGVQLAARLEAADARLAIESVLADASAPYRVEALAVDLGAPPAPADAERAVPGPQVRVVATEIGDDVEAEFAGLGTFDLGASSQLVLFVFITTLSGATRIVEARELGVTRRMLATPTTSGQIVLGEGLGRFAVALFQAAWIVVASLLLFDVNWGSPLGALVVITAFAGASAGASMLLGAVAKNVNQAGGLSTLFGLTLAALGGSMAPLDIFGDTLRRVAHVTPHAWANDAFAELTRRDGGVADILPEVAVLLGFAVVLWTVAGRRLQATLTA